MYAERKQKTANRKVIEKTTKQVSKSHSSFKSSNRANKVSQFQTEINYYSKSIKFGNTEAHVGSKMNASLDPEDPVQGSKPAPKSLETVMNYYKSVVKDKMVKGHLLNANLGGLGITANLFPITYKANHEHLQKVESPIKQMLITKEQNKKKQSEHESKKKELIYNVEVIHNEQSLDTTFQCEYGWNTEPMKKTDINSSPLKNETAPKWTEEEEKLLLSKIQEMGSNWKKIKEFFPNRTKKHLKCKYYQLLRKTGIESDPKHDLEDEQDTEKKTEKPLIKNSRLPKGWGEVGRGFNPNYHKATLDKTTITYNNLGETSTTNEFSEILLKEDLQ